MVHSDGAYPEPAGRPDSGGPPVVQFDLGGDPTVEAADCGVRR